MALVKRKEKDEVGQQMLLELEKRGIQARLCQLTLNQLEIHRLNPRRRLKEMDERDPFVESIKEVGVVKPLLCHQENGSIGILDGGRRFRGAELAKNVETVPVVLTWGLDTKQILTITCALNTTSEPMNALDEGEMVKNALREVAGCSPENVTIADLEKIVSVVGMSSPTALGRLKILRLPEVVQLAIEAGDIPLNLAVFLASQFGGKDYLEAWKRWQEFAKDFKERYGRKPPFPDSQLFLSRLAEEKKPSLPAPVPIAKKGCRTEGGNGRRGKLVSSPGTKNPQFLILSHLKNGLAALEKAITMWNQLPPQQRSPKIFENLVVERKLWGLSPYDVLTHADEMAGELEILLEQAKKEGHDFGKAV